MCPRSQKTLNHLSWCLIILNGMRTAEQREREVLSASKLQPNDEGKSKAGSGVAVVVYAAVKALDVPVNNIDYCCTDTTNSNSGCLLQRAGSAAMVGRTLTCGRRSKPRATFFSICYGACHTWLL